MISTWFVLVQVLAALFTPIFLLVIVGNRPVRNHIVMDQDALNAAVAASLAFLAAHPVPGLNVSSATATLHILQTMRKYDGSYSAEIWLQDFNQECTANNLNDEWKIRNIDRVLDGTAATWWKSQRNGYVRQAAVNGAVHADIFTTISDSMREFFSAVSIKERARLENEHVKFKYGDDPVAYVARKIDVLTRMNPTMGVSEQVTQLLLGLPRYILEKVSPGDVSTVDKFTSKLSSQLSLHRQEFAEKSRQYRGQTTVGDESTGQSPQINYRKVGYSQSKPSRQHANNYQGGSGNRQSKKSNVNKPIPGLEIPDFSDDHKASCVDADGNRVCFFCKKKGHTVKSCFALAREQGVPIPSNSKRQGN